VLNANKVCLLGQTLAKELFEDASPIGKEIRIKNVLFRVMGVLGPKGANMMGSDQDDILLAPWTTIKYRVTGSPLTTANQSLSSGSSSSVNTLSNVYPAANLNSTRNARLYRLPTIRCLCALQTSTKFWLPPEALRRFL